MQLIGSDQCFICRRWHGIICCHWLHPHPCEPGMSWPASPRGMRWCGGMGRGRVRGGPKRSGRMRKGRMRKGRMRKGRMRGGRRRCGRMRSWRGWVIGVRTWSSRMGCGHSRTGAMGSSLGSRTSRVSGQVCWGLGTDHRNRCVPPGMAYW